MKGGEIAFIANFHRQRCICCGKVYMTLVGHDFWSNPLNFKAQFLCDRCLRKKRKESGNGQTGLFKRR